MQAVAFDTMKTVEMLTDAGLEDRQAKAIASAMRDAMAASVATKADVADLKTGLESLETRTQAMFYRGLLFQGAGIVAAIAALKLVP